VNSITAFVDTNPLDALPLADEPADDIEILFDKLEYPETATQVLSQVTPIQAFWLARHIRQHVEMGRQVMGDEIERELQVCVCYSVHNRA